MKEASRFRTILGVRFFVGTAAEAIAGLKNGGLLLVPAAPALKNLPHDADYREALQAADLILPDSAFMVMVWNRLQKDSIRRLSGLEYLSCLLKQPSFLEAHESFWIMASPESSERNRAWLRRQGIHLTEDDIHIAPVYGRPIEDVALLQRLNKTHPKHIIVTVGGGTQERLGLYLRRELDDRAAIHCIGAAIAFLSGDQVRIPAWADRIYIGWLLRCLSNPRRFLPRYWDARKLFSLLLRYRENPPDSV